MMPMKTYWNEGGRIAFGYALGEAVVQFLLLKLLVWFAPKNWGEKLRLNVSNRCIASLHAIGKRPKLMFHEHVLEHSLALLSSYFSLSSLWIRCNIVG